MPERLVEPIPRDIEEALIRELVSLVPILGDLYGFIEFIEAVREGRYDAALVYLIGVAGPGPTLPLSHVIAHLLGKEKR